STRSSRAGTWSFVLAAPHQRFSPTLHGALALVVEADGFQPWREALPSPASSWDGSDVVLQPRTAADDAVVVVSGAPDGAIVRLRRLGDLDTVFRGGRPAGEAYDFAVPAGGKLTVNVPLLPSPLVPRPGQPYDQLGWGVQLLAPGRTTAEQPIVAGQTVTLTAATPARAVAATRADGTAVPVARVLAALPDRTLRWFAAPGGEVPEDALLPVVAIETGVEPENGLVLPWPGQVPAPPPAAVRSLRFVDGNGQPVGDASVWWFAPDELARTKALRLRPHLPAATSTRADGAACAVREDVARRPSAWVTCPGRVPQLVLDVRAACDAEGVGTVVLAAATSKVDVRVRTAEGQPVTGAFVCCSDAQQGADGLLVGDGLSVGADGSLPVTDAQGRCTVSCSTRPLVALFAPGFEFGFAHVDKGRANVQATAVVPWRLQGVDTRGAPLPFRELGCQTPLHEGPEGSSYTNWSVITDSRGNATHFGPVAALATSQIGAALLGHNPRRGLIAASDEVTAIPCREDPLIVVRVPAGGAGFARCELAWTNWREATILGWQPQIPPLDGQALLLRWPAGLVQWAHDVPAAPPVVIRFEAPPAGGPLVLDCRQIARTVPLQLRGDVPDDLAPLRAVPRAIAGLRVDGSMAPGGDYLDADRSRLRLHTRDLLEHEVLLLHPRLVPATVALAAGAGGDPVTADVKRGAPCTLVFTQERPLWAQGRAFCWVCPPGRYQERIAVTDLVDPRLFTDAVERGIEIPAPFALPEGDWEVNVEAVSRRTARVSVKSDA
ncbi:MAG TPA: hypothetical protein VFT55_10575, partial [Planctomycetota bacterium]|nr:hypothetical protein [Planctomycetota bacterium]